MALNGNSGTDDPLNNDAINNLESKRKISDGDVAEDIIIFPPHIRSRNTKRMVSSSLRERRPLAFHTSTLASPSSVPRKLEYSGTHKTPSSFRTSKGVAFLIALLSLFTIVRNLVLLNSVKDRDQYGSSGQNRMRYQAMSLFKPRKRDDMSGFILKSLLDFHHNGSGIPIFVAIGEEDDIILQRLHLLTEMVENFNSYSERLQQRFNLFPFSRNDQVDFLKETVSGECFSHNTFSLPLQYDTLLSLWKYCALYLFGGVFLDISKVTLLQVPWMLPSFPNRSMNTSNSSKSPFLSDFNAFVIDVEAQQIEESFMIWNEKQSPTLLLLLKHIMSMNNTDDQNTAVTTENESMRKHLLFQTHYKEGNNRTSLFLRQRCAYVNVGHSFPKQCEVYHPRTSQILMLTNLEIAHPHLPPCPSSRSEECRLIANKEQPDDLASIIPMETIYLNKARREKNPPKRQSYPEFSTPNFFQIMIEHDCLPTNRHCQSCLISEGSCKKCINVCFCYCNALCLPKFKPRPKFVKKIFLVKHPWLPSHQYDMIPRKIHQIWIDELSKEQYPKMSRAVNSFKNSKWGEHYLWDLERDIPTFLQDHFPPEVVDAYNSLTLPRFKSDLARYCIALIHGGVYAEPDIILNADLQNAIDKDIGFMAVVVNISRPMNGHQASSCLWSGFFASAPGHPFLAKLIETIVNNIRNRFTSVDYDAMFCPYTPNFELSWKYPNHMTTGSCIFGTAVNSVLGRTLSSPFEAGELTYNHLESKDGKFPGRSMILQPEFTEKKTLRFMNAQENLIIGTSLRSEVETWPESMLYTSATTGKSVKNNIYGRNGIYVDDISTHEEIMFYTSFTK